ncbi:MAG TPA: phosphoribosylformylglycinamidine synthase subunit PurS [Campylobacterales bacterium]|nr:phosphoribosylformylglycinamidine synthase subunit PurS [Campylobacterales bacterium]
MKAIVNIYLKDGVLDPQGKAVHHALKTMGFLGVSDVRMAKQIILELDAANEEEARAEVEKMCETLLANTVIENYTFELNR